MAGNHAAAKSKKHALPGVATVAGAGSDSEKAAEKAAQAGGKGTKGGKGSKGKGGEPSDPTGAPYDLTQTR